VQTRVGWHIIRLINRFEPGTYEEEKSRLEARISKDERVVAARKAMIETIKIESGLTEKTAPRDSFIATLKEDFLTFQWNATGGRDTVIEFADGSIKTLADFMAYLKAKTRERMRAARSESPQSVAGSLYDAWLDDLCLEYEEARLEQKYPDFHALMREYEEGILLFEVTKMMVWDKASQDTAGLKAFFKEHRENYMWPERADLINITLQGDQAAKAEAKTRKLLAKYPIETIAAKINKKGQVLTFQRKRVNEEEILKQGLEWKSGYTTTTTVDDAPQTRQFSTIATLLPPQPKALDEARGYVIADYQDALEKEWVEDLRQQYPVTVHQDVLSSLIRK
jgi:peptidyl-prolyl cis-trans isomerase SurA